MGSPAGGIDRLHERSWAGTRVTRRMATGWAEGRQGDCMLVNGAIVAGKGAGAVKGRSTEEIEQIRTILSSRFDELNAEYEDAVTQNQRLRLVEIGDAAGDDQADSGSKTAERDAATSLIRTLLDRRAQAEQVPGRDWSKCRGTSRGAAFSCENLNDIVDERAGGRVEEGIAARFADPPGSLVGSTSDRVEDQGGEEEQQGRADQPLHRAEAEAENSVDRAEHG